MKMERYSIIIFFKINKNWLLLINKYNIDIIIWIIKNNYKQFLIVKKIFYISKNKIDKIIKE